jgi:hypothetical protein
MSKQKASKLDPYAESLRGLDKEGKTLAEMQEWLKAEGVTVSSGRLSEFLESLRQAEDEQRIFGLIASGGRMNSELDKAYEENPAPGIDRLITVTKSLVMSLQVKGAADPKLLSLANSMQQTVLNYTTGVTKAALEQQKLSIAERKLKLLETKAQQADQAKGILENKELSEEQKRLRMREVFGIS